MILIVGLQGLEIDPLILKVTKLILYGRRLW